TLIGLIACRSARKMRGIRRCSRTVRWPTCLTRVASRSSPTIRTPFTGPRRLRSCPLPLTFCVCSVIFSIASLTEVSHAAELASPRRGVAGAVQEFLAAGGGRDFRAMPVLRARQHRLRRYGAVVQHALELGELGVHEATKRRSNFDVTAGEFESHDSAFSSQL